MAIPSAAAQFRLRGWDAASSSSTPVVSTSSSTGPARQPAAGSGVKPWLPGHRLFYLGCYLAAGLGLFGYATERGIGIRGSAHVGSASAEAGAQIT